jgi:beta-N-acetylhexosaminidase
MMSRQPDSRVVEKFLVGFEGTCLPAPLGALLEQGLAGVVIYARNCSSLEGLRALTEEIHAAARRGGHPTALVGMDQEGGQRFALPEPFTPWPSATELGLVDDSAAAEQVGAAIARELRAVGCNLDFAPMLDLALQPDSPVTRDRSFGADPARVARLGTSFARGLSSEGVLACAKHFPGHGDTLLDPHEELPLFDASLDRLVQVELVPFAAAVRAGMPVIMTAHILLPQIDAGRPASLSRFVLDSLLRQRLGFGGVILADDLGMGAICKHRTPGQAAIESFQAGSDIAMLCHDWSAVAPAIEAVQHARVAGQLDAGELQASRARIARLRAELDKRGPSAPSVDVVGCAAHRSLAERIRARIGRTSR